MQTATRAILGTLEEFGSIFKENYFPLFRYVNGIVNDNAQSKNVLSDLFLKLCQQENQLQINDLKPAWA